MVNDVADEGRAQVFLVWRPSALPLSAHGSQPGPVDRSKNSRTSASMKNPSTTTRNSTASGSTIRVVAPATLQEGYQFDVLLHNAQPYTITVPKGGVRAGQEFEIPIEQYTFSSDNDEEVGDDDCDAGGDVGNGGDTKNIDGEEEHEHDDPASKDNNNFGKVHGRWRRSLCSCCDVLTQATFWMGFVCTPILMAQLMTRLGLDWKGRECPDEEERALTYNRIIMAAIAVLLLGYIPGIGAVIMLLFWLFVVVWIGTNARGVVRRRYRIPATCCAGCCDGQLSDCLCMLVCGCCSTIQMARQTHDDHEFPGYCCTTSGLPPDAPTLV